MLAISRTPVEMWTGHAAGRANEADLLAALDGIPDRDECLGQVKVARNDASAMIDVHDVAGEEEIVHQRDYAPIGSNNRIARLPGEIDPSVTARQTSIEESAGSERARDPRAARPQERLGPELGRRMRMTSNGARLLVFSLDTGFGQ